MASSKHYAEESICCFKNANYSLVEKDKSICKKTECHTCVQVDDEGSAIANVMDVFYIRKLLFTHNIINLRKAAKWHEETKEIEK